VPWPLAERDALLARVEALFPGDPIDRLDGIRVERQDGWLLARKSVTEPLVTFRIEARDEAGLERLRNQLVAAIPELADRHAFFAREAHGGLAPE
jgi:phosphomannomutase